MQRDDESGPESNLGNEVYEALLRDILSARLPGGTPIQQRRLALEHNVSRSPMRHALGRLEGEGLLVRDESGGLCVRAVTLKEYLKSLDMKVLLEPAAAEAAAANPDVAALDALVGQLNVLTQATAPDPEDIWAFDEALHLYVTRQSGNPFMVAVVADLRRYTTIFERQLPVVHAIPAVDQYAALLDTLVAGDGAAARAAMLRHLNMVRHGVLRNY